MADTNERMKTVLINGVPYRIRADMPAGYLEMLEADRFEREVLESIDAGENALTREYERGYQEGYRDAGAEIDGHG
tara:strand:- start:348 stop:575 length:228 start_codon:yes stop_codon:yes gene_type:complete